MNVADEIGRLNKLRAEGALTDEEFQKAKASLLANQQTAGAQIKNAVDEMADENTWGMLLHLSQFCGYAIPLAGLVIPIVMWQWKKDASVTIDRHGRIVVNWMISELIYLIVFSILSAFLIGIPFLLALIIMAIAYPIIGAVKARNGKTWIYPLSIRFFKIPDESPLPPAVPENNSRQ